MDKDDELCECPVCTTPLRETISTRPPCGHEVCLKCLLRLHRPQCVLCRADLSELIPRPSNVVLVRRNPELYVESLLALVERVDRRETITAEAVADDSGDTT